jgi:hypothetical protein
LPLKDEGVMRFDPRTPASITFESRGYGGKPMFLVNRQEIGLERTIQLALVIPNGLNLAIDHVWAFRHKTVMLQP